MCLKFLIVAFLVLSCQTTSDRGASLGSRPDDAPLWARDLPTSFELSFRCNSAAFALGYELKGELLASSPEYYDDYILYKQIVTSYKLDDGDSAISYPADATGMTRFKVFESGEQVFLTERTKEQQANDQGTFQLASFAVRAKDPDPHTGTPQVETPQVTVHRKQEDGTPIVVTKKLRCTFKDKHQTEKKDTP